MVEGSNNDGNVSSCILLKAELYMGIKLMSGSDLCLIK